MFAPGIPDVQAEFHNDNEQLASFVVSVYILGFAFGPMVTSSPFLSPTGPLFPPNNLGSPNAQSLQRALI